MARESKLSPPPVVLYIGINIVLWLGLFFVMSRDASPTGRILLIAGLAVALMMTVSVQVILHFTLDHARYHPARRALIFLLPTAVALAMTLVLPGRRNPLNQQKVLASPNGEFRLVMSIHPGPKEGPPMAWVLSLEDQNGQVVYTDDHSPFDATRTTVFWLWDAENRVWLYSRGDESTWYWERDDGGAWVRKQYTKGEAPAPPEGLRP